MPYLLNLAYLVFLLAATPWLAWKALQTGKYRQGWAQKLLGRVPLRAGSRSCVWLHAVSVGEVNLLRPLVDELRRQRPDVECVVSTTTRTGYDLARRKYADLTVFYAPLDFTWSVGRAMRRLRPNLLVLVELELWPNLIRAARRQDVHVAIVNGRLSDASFRGYARWQRLVARVLEQVDVVAAQNPEYAQRFLALGALPETVSVTGSIKYDGAETHRDNVRTRELARLAHIAPDDIVLLAGSTQDPEEALAVKTFRELAKDHPRLRLILVPRHPERFDAVARLLDQSGLAWTRRSELLADRQPPTPEPRPRILLVDAIGELGAWWGTAHVGFVGGSLGSRGGQNMIEPAAYGVATCFGPNTHNFRDVVDELLTHEAAVVVKDGDELTQFVRRTLVDERYAQALGRRARSLVADQLGATARTCELLTPLLPAEAQAHDARAA